MLKKIIQKSWTFFQICVSCPTCVDNRRMSPQSFWSHEGCSNNGSMYVGENAHLLCESCKKQAHINFWIFRCPLCSESRLEQLRFSKEGNFGGHCISTAGQMVSHTGHRWLIEFMRNLGDN